MIVGTGIPRTEVHGMDRDHLALSALVERLEDTEDVLNDMANAKLERGHESDADRLRGKAQGVRLALNLIKDMEA